MMQMHADVRALCAWPAAFLKKESVACRRDTGPAAIDKSQSRRQSGPENYA